MDEFHDEEQKATDNSENNTPKFEPRASAVGKNCHCLVTAAEYGLGNFGCYWKQSNQRRVGKASLPRGPQSSVQYFDTVGWMIGRTFGL